MGDLKHPLLFLDAVNSQELTEFPAYGRTAKHFRSAGPWGAVLTSHDIQVHALVLGILAWNLPS